MAAVQSHTGWKVKVALDQKNSSFLLQEVEVRRGGGEEGEEFSLHTPIRLFPLQELNEL